MYVCTTHRALDVAGQHEEHARDVELHAERQGVVENRALGSIASGCIAATAAWAGRLGAIELPT